MLKSECDHICLISITIEKHLRLDTLFKKEVYLAHHSGDSRA
jgi:hypothetical protein